MLNESVNEYLELRRGLGFKLVDTGELLANFSAFATARGDVVVRAQTAIAWAALGPSAARRHRRLRVLALLVEHLYVEDPRHERIPMHPFPSTPSLRPVPRIFSAREIGHVIALATLLKPAGSIRPSTYATLFGLLFATGMRISEALRLRLEDVDGAGLTIRQTKFGKSRWLPLHASTREALEQHLVVRRALAADTDRLFLSWRRNLPLDRTAVLSTFQGLCAEAGFAGVGARRKPRLHDLRHSFATHALRRCAADRDAVEQHMLALSTYLGHVSISSTYWYLESTPELMRDIAGACDGHADARDDARRGPSA